MSHGRGRLRQLGLQDLLPRWLLHQMCGTSAGMTRRMGSAVAVSSRAYLLLMAFPLWQLQGSWTCFGNSGIPESQYLRGSCGSCMSFYDLFSLVTGCHISPNLLFKTITKLNHILEEESETPSLDGGVARSHCRKACEMGILLWSVLESTICHTSICS